MQSREVGFEFGRARFGESANWHQFIPDRFLESHLTTSEQLVGDIRSVSVHILLTSEPPRSGHLGCQFVPAEQDTIIRVGILDTLDSKELFTGDGLTTEAAHVVLSEAIQLLKHDNFLGTGILTFDEAYHHPIEYFPLGARLMTQASLMLLRAEFEQADANVIQATIRDLWREIRSRSL